MKKHQAQLFSWRALAVCGLLALWQGAAADAVGTTQGDFGVSGQGAATWRVAIQMPPGARGFEPQLALAYNSQAGNGIAGIGWMLEGLSVIRRCARDLAQDGDYDGPLQVVLDERDRFCLDGQRLAVVSGSYGGDGGEYRTRIESFSRVRSYGWSGTSDEGRSLGPRKFKVWRRDGVVMDYGRSDASRLYASEASEASENGGGGAVRVWLLDRISDRFGNEIVIRYHKDGERGYRVERMDYGNSRVLFNYERRGDVERRFRAGAGTVLNHRLTAISTYTSWKLVRRYDLAYVPHPQHAAGPDALYPSRLASVTECLSDECLPPTRFDWHEQPTDRTADWTVQASAPAALRLFRNSDDFRLGFGDFNGDGLNDVYEVRGDRGRVRDRLYLNLGDGRFNAVDGADTELSGSEGAGQFHFADFDGDGRADVYQLRYRHDHDVIYLSRTSGGRVSFERVNGLASGTHSQPDTGRCLDIACLKIGDFDGDGRSDIYRINGRGDDVFLSNGDGTFRRVAGIHAALRSGRDEARVDVRRLHLGDFDGDGRSDIYYLQANTDDLHLTVRPGVYRRVNGVGVSDRFGTGDTSVYRYRFADFNGDGLADVYYNGLRSGGVHSSYDSVYLSKGDGTYHHKNGRYRGRSSPSYGADRLADVRVGDFNGDGKSDLFEKNGDREGSICFVNAASGCAQVRVRFDGFSPTHLQFLDFNGDGASDVYWTDHGGGHTASRGLNPGYAIVRMTDGFGVRTDIAYGHLADAEVHRVDGQSAYPDVFAYPPMRVVRRVLTEDDQGELNNPLLYRYGNAKIHLGGHGFLGFAWRDEIAPVRGIATRTRYLQDFPYTGQVASVTSKLHDDAAWDDNTSVLSSAHSRYDRVELNRGASIFVRLARSKGARYDLSLDPVSQTGADFEYDDFGNVTRTTEQAGGDGRTFTTVTLKQYDNDEERWLPGQLRRTEVTHEADGQTTVSRETRRLQRDPHTGVVTREIIGSGSSMLQHEYRYDGFGNRVAKVEHGRSYVPGGTLHRWEDVRRETRTFYGDDGLFPLRTVNPLGHTVTSRFGRRFGQLLSVTDANGLTTNKHYNRWGRQTGTRRADGVSSSRRHLWICPHHGSACSDAEQWGGAPARAVYAVVEETAGETPRVDYYDRFQRKIRQASVGDGGRKVFRDTVHDRFGRPVAESLPYFSGDPVYWTRRQYDVLDRIVSTETPLEDGVAVSRIEYRGLAVDYINARDLRKTIVKDALGRTVRIVEPEGAVIENTYDPAGRLIAVHDAHGNETTMRYNLRGEKIRLEDPDVGWKSYGYDAFGNVVWDDAPGNNTTRVYDKLGRLTHHYYLRADKHNAWTYDTADNGIGKLAKKKSFDNHIEQYRYDDLGRLAEVNDLRGYVIRTGYDRHGRAARVTRPGGFVVERAYDGQGRLQSLRSPRAHIPDFDAGRMTAARREALQVQTAARTRATFYEARVREYQGRVALYREAAESYLESPEDLPWSGDKAAELKQRLGAIADALVRRIAELRAEVARLQSFANQSWQTAQLLPEFVMEFVPTQSCGWRSSGWQSVGWQSNGWQMGGSPQLDRFSCETVLDYQMMPNVTRQGYETHATTLWRQASEKRSLVAEKAGELETLVRAEIGDDWQTVARWVLLDAEFRTMRSDLDELDRARKRLAAQRGRAAHYGGLSGHYQAISGAAGDHVYHWRAVSRDAAGRVASEVYGNSLHGENRYHPATGRLLERATLTASGRDVQRHAYAYDALGNLLSRNDWVRGVEESFAYDDLDRLVSSMVTGNGLGEDYNRMSFYRYDEIGNLVSKSGIGAYTYGRDGRQPHAVSATPRGQYHYDSYGRMVDSPGFAAAWNVYNKPASITRKSDGRELRMYYDADLRKIKQLDSAAGETVYVGNRYEKVTKDGAVQHRHYIHAEGRLVAVKSIVGGGGPQTGDFRYFHWDVLGSPNAVSDGGGNIVETFSYTPFGERRATPGDGDGGGAAASAYTRRGFTGHEHLDAFGLVDMKGRVYDPAIGRFLSPDPHVQAPDRTQSHNRYSYVLNNPMKYVDPSGFFFKKLIKKAFRSIKKLFKKPIVRFAVAAVAGYFAGSWAYSQYLGKWGATAAAAASKAPSWALTNASLIQGAVGGATFSASSSALNGDFNGILGNGLRGALGGSLSGGVNAYFSPGNWSTARVFADSLAGGASEVLHGGKFADGFKASFRAAALTATALGMREKMIAQSRLDPRNAAGKSAGFFGDGFKLAGGRIVAWLAEQVPSPFGGVQGGQGAFFGHAYEPGSWLDLVHEAYAGPHDYLNSGYWYDSMGNIKRMSAFARGFGEVLNVANLVVATPFVAASVTPAWATRSLR